MRFLWLVCLAALTPCLSVAQDSKEYQECNRTANTQMEMNLCASEDATRADAELNRVYAALLSVAKTDPVALAKLKTAERAWLVYRDAYVEAMYPAKNKQAEYGSIYPMQVAITRARLTRQQVEDLKVILRQRTGQ